MRSFDNRNHNFNLLVPRQYRGYFAKFYAYPDSDPIAMLRVPWETSLRCHGALGVPPATLLRVCCDATATCFRGDLTALVLSMFKTWRRPTAICSAATALCEISQRPCGDQRRSGRFCRSQRGRRPVWLGYNALELCLSFTNPSIPSGNIESFPPIWVMSS